MPIVTPTKISLISDALVLLGEKPASSLTENRYGVTVGANLFEAIYENELCSNRWRFAMTKDALSQLVDAPLNEWQFAYQLPPDMLIPIGVYPAAQYEIYADHLYTNRSTVELDYLFKPEVSEIPAYFAQLMRYALARDMIKPLTESDTGVQLMEGKYNRQRDRALFADAQGRPNRSIADSPFTRGRVHTSR
jgi:hypothetical protein